MEKVNGCTPQVKSDYPAFNPGDTMNKLAVAYAVEHGYPFRLDSDGSAEVSKPDGMAYYMVNFVCDCPDALKKCAPLFEVGLEVYQEADKPVQQCPMGQAGVLPQNGHRPGNSTNSRTLGISRR